MTKMVELEYDMILQVLEAERGITCVVIEMVFVVVIDIQRRNLFIFIYFFFSQDSELGYTQDYIFSCASD